MVRIHIQQFGEPVSGADTLAAALAVVETLRYFNKAYGDDELYGEEIWVHHSIFDELEDRIHWAGPLKTGISIVYIGPDSVRAGKPLFAALTHMVECSPWPTPKNSGANKWKCWRRVVDGWFS